MMRGQIARGRVERLRQRHLDEAQNKAIAQEEVTRVLSVYADGLMDVLRICEQFQVFKSELR